MICIDQNRDEGRQVFYNANVGKIEYSRMGVFIDRNNEFSVSYSCDMLAGTGYPAGKIEFWSDSCAGDTNLVVVREPFFITYRP